jgi:major membrane immunogen (membrane-anchored lipoprotein)
MKKALLAFVACAVLSLSGCGKDEGNSFVGVWKNSDSLSETLTITKVDGGYRALSQIDKDTKGFMKVESVLVAESDKMLVKNGNQKRALELSANGTITSYLRNKPDTFTKVN